MTTIELRRTPSAVIHPAASRAAAIPADSLHQTARVALVAAAASVPPITFLHLNATDAVNPATWTISDYVVTLPHGIPLFAMTTGALAIGAIVLARGLAVVAGTRFVRALLSIWAVALLAAAIFPTNLRGTPQNFSSNVHLIAGAVVFAVLPLAGWLVSRHHRLASGRSTTTVALSAVSLASGALSTALILNRLPGVVGLPELMPPGILQRAAGAVEIVLLAVLATAVLASARRAR
jgi:hypothetical protein